MNTTPTDITALPHARGLRLMASASLLVLLAGCAVTDDAPQATAPLPERYHAWFEDGQPRNLEWMHKQTVEKADEAAAAGNPREAIRLLTSLTHQGFPQAHYELGKLHDQGEAMERDPGRAAEHYARAVRTPSYIRGHAAINLAKLYREGDGVEHNDLLAYHLLRLAVKEEVGRDERVMLAELLREGGDGVSANPERAARLYAIEAEQGQEEALRALAEAHAPDGWLDEKPERAMDYARRYAEALRKRAAAGETDAMRRLAGLHAPDGLLGDQPEQRLHWLRQAAEAGDKDVLGNAGNALLDAGETRQGVAMLEEAAKHGDVDAMTKLGGLLVDPERSPTRPAAGKRWLERAVEAGNADAMEALGATLVAEARRRAEAVGELRDNAGSSETPSPNLAEPTRFTPPEAQRGIALLERAAEQDHALAMTRLGDLYLEGELVASQPYLAIDYLGRAHELGHPWATQQLGAAYLEGRGVTQDGRRAAGLLREAGKQGQAGALRLLGEAHLQEQGPLPFHPSRAESLLEEALEAGDDTAMAVLGEAYLRGPLPEDSGRGLALLERAARNGDANAMLVLGRAYRDGDGVGQDLDEATRWLTRAREAGSTAADEVMVGVNRKKGAGGDINALIEAAEQGHPGAMADLGRAFREGRGVQADSRAARRWLEQAANAGHTGARAELGEMLLDGEPQRALSLLQAAADAGHQGARLTLGQAYLKGDSVEADAERGIGYLRPLAEAGNPHAARELGVAYQEGLGVAADPEQAREWLERAAENGDLASRANLGRSLLRGEAGMPVDTERGQELLQEAADQGHPGAMATLGREYIRGENLEQDVRHGADYLLKAAEQGHSSARLALAKAYLAANGLENASREQALVWLDGVMEGDSSIALQTLHELLSDESAAEALEVAAAE
ncbi:sel1 repeat family protein [Halomonas sp. SSL-5]|uniref:tetratricopeptide repeat protein n=1 Tax=Halomonas sp. SSL-5 TaxID=3065855 RepID=UPI0027396485|nr:sel1 repeat family protein [Halomonas sp. SSL-5]MDY7115668.1 sel1 repeat family protein [Halomonas sp. SSL-5]